MAKFYIEDNDTLCVDDLVPGSMDDAIEKWEFIAEHPEVKYGYRSETCSLCLKYGDENCVGCPIYEDTGEDDCHGTLFHSWCSARNVEDKVYYAKEMVSMLREIAEDSGRDCAEGSGRLESERAADLSISEDDHD